ncbi:MAG: hypothetical protein FWF29_08110 [Treponema sp.]|nr:hypothetical protein [Treponema sp.]
MSGGGRGDNRGNRRRPFRNRQAQAGQKGGDREQQSSDARRAETVRPDYTAKKADSQLNSGAERPQWIPPQMSNEPIPVPECPYCGKPIKDMSLAIADKNTGQAVHFDCIISRLSQGENLESGEVISYIGGGRFGIIHYANPSNPQVFTIKKIFEWENKENRAEWRQIISDHFSVT